MVPFPAWTLLYGLIRIAEWSRQSLLCRHDFHAKKRGMNSLLSWYITMLVNLWGNGVDTVARDQ
jgi:hypothetical protein